GRVVTRAGGGVAAGMALVRRHLGRRYERSADLGHPGAGSVPGLELRLRDVARCHEAAGDLHSVVRGRLADRDSNGRGDHADDDQLEGAMEFHPAPFAISCDSEQDGEAAILLPAAKMRPTYGGDLVSTWSVLRQSCKPRSPVGLVNPPANT